MYLNTILRHQTIPGCWNSMKKGSETVALTKRHDFPCSKHFLPNESRTRL